MCLKPSLGCRKALGAYAAPRRGTGPNDCFLGTPEATATPLPQDGHCNTLARGNDPVPLTTVSTGDQSSDELWYLLESSTVSVEEGKGEGVQTRKTEFRGGKAIRPFPVSAPCQTFSFFSKDLDSKGTPHFTALSIHSQCSVSKAFFSISVSVSYGIYFLGFKQSLLLFYTAFYALSPHRELFTEKLH